MTMCAVSIVSPQMQRGFVTVERDLIDISVRMRSNTTRIAQTRPLIAVWGPVMRPFGRYWSNGCSTKL